MIDIIQLINIETYVVYAFPTRKVENDIVVSTFSEKDLMTDTKKISKDFKNKYADFCCNMDKLSDVRK